MIGAECVEEVLYNSGVRDVFGYSGSMMLRIMDTIYRKGRISFHHMFHEQACSFAADGYARTKGQLGVVIVTSGPGAINALAGVADAYLDSIPLLLITGQDNSKGVIENNGYRMNGFQDLNVVEIAKPITKYSVRIENQSDIVYELEKAIYYATTGRKGPVVVDIPMDFQYLEMPNVKIPHFVNDIEIEAYDTSLLEPLIERLHMSSRPLFLIGGGVRSSGNTENMRLLHRLTGIPVVTTLNGIDSGVETIGFSGLYGNLNANIAVYNADLIVALGCRFGSRQTGKLLSDYTNATIIHYDIDKLELGRVIKGQIEKFADITNVIGEFINWAKANQGFLFRRWDTWTSYLYEKKRYIGVDVNDNSDVNPIGVVEKFVKNRDGLIITADVGQNEAWTAVGMGGSADNRFLCSSGYGSMGFSLPAAIGASSVDPQATVLSFSGDGGFQMNMQELEYLKLHQNNVKCIVFNNNTLGMMREVQKLHYQSKFYGSNIEEFQCPDLEKLAVAYNLEYCCINSMEDVYFAKKLINKIGPCIIDVKVDMDFPSRNKYDDLELIKKSRMEINDVFAK